MSNKYMSQDVLKMVEENDISFIRLQFTDVFGTLNNVVITAKQLPKVLEEGCMFDGPLTVLYGLKNLICC